MREIKFRAWDKDKKVLLYDGFYFRNHCITDNVLYNFMQYTGLKDKNGKEIYEGDIVKKEGEEFEVIWSDGSFHIFAHHEYDYLLGNAYSSEVIGNIMENKDLLK